MMPKLEPATTKSLGIAFAMIKPDTHMPTMMPTCVHRFLPVRKSTSESGAARPREARPREAPRQMVDALFLCGGNR